MTETRFAFGHNWQRYSRGIDEARIVAAESSLQNMLNVSALTGRTFLDVGCGSGLFSLAARRLGARVHSFDYDEASVSCARELKLRHFPADVSWQIERGSILDGEYTRALGTFDVVYAWGVLHHTGELWRALAATCELVNEHGTLFTAIYNDQGETSRRWTTVKRTYNVAPRPVRAGIVLGVGGYLGVKGALRRLSGARSASLESPRGMSRWYDLIDWVGGYPFEVSTPEHVIEFVQARGFRLARLERVDGLGCNEFVLRRP